MEKGPSQGVHNQKQQNEYQQRVDTSSGSQITNYLNIQNSLSSTGLEYDDSEAYNNKLHSHIKSAFASSTTLPSTSSNKRFKLPRRSGGGLPVNTIYSAKKSKGVEKYISDPTQHSLAKSKRVGFLKPVGELPACAPAISESDESYKNLGNPNRSCKTGLKPLTEPKTSRTSIALNAAKILSAPKLGQSFSGRVSVTAVKNKSPRKRARLVGGKKQEEEISDDEERNVNGKSYVYEGVENDIEHEKEVEIDQNNRTQEKKIHTKTDRDREKQKQREAQIRRESQREREIQKAKARAQLWERNQEQVQIPKPKLNVPSRLGTVPKVKGVPKPKIERDLDTVPKVKEVPKPKIERDLDTVPKVKEVPKQKIERDLDAQIPPQSNKSSNSLGNKPVAKRVQAPVYSPDYNVYSAFSPLHTIQSSSSLEALPYNDFGYSPTKLSRRVYPNFAKSYIPPPHQNRIEINKRFISEASDINKDNKLDILKNQILPNINRKNFLANTRKAPYIPHEDSTGAQITQKSFPLIKNSLQFPTYNDPQYINPYSDIHVSTTGQQVFYSKESETAPKPKTKFFKSLTSPPPTEFAKSKRPGFHRHRNYIMEHKRAKKNEPEKNNNNDDEDDRDNKDLSGSDDTTPTTASTSKKRKINEDTTAKSSDSAASAGPSTSTTQPAAEEDEKDKEDDKDAKKKKNRCTECRKKVGLTGFLCRCGGLYCAVHRYSDKHNCTFDYREHGAQEIRRNNPVVVGEKIQKI